MCGVGGLRGHSSITQSDKRRNVDVFVFNRERKAMGLSDSYPVKPDDPLIFGKLVPGGAFHYEVYVPFLKMLTLYVLRRAQFL